MDMRNNQVNQHPGPSSASSNGTDLEAMAAQYVAKKDTVKGAPNSDTKWNVPELDEKT